MQCPKCGQSNLLLAKASEVGNVFDLGQKYGKDFNLQFMDEQNAKHYPIMGCYGIGISRLMGVIVEKFNDDKGIIWPQSVAPFLAHLVVLPSADNEEVVKSADKMYADLHAAGIPVLYDDREGVSAGQKFADSDLIGIPQRIVISAKTLAQSSVELKQRNSSEAILVPQSEIIQKIIDVQRII